jgi:hypothetical protein
LEIGSKPTQRAYRAKQGGDTFIQVDTEDDSVRSYQTVETHMMPSVETALGYQDKPYYSDEETGMVYVLEEIASANWTHATSADAAADIMEDLKTPIQQL